MRDIIPRGERSIYLNDRKVIYSSFTCGFFVFFFNALYTKTWGSFTPMCHDINYSRKLQSILLIYELVVVFARMK